MATIFQHPKLKKADVAEKVKKGLPIRVELIDSNGVAIMYTADHLKVIKKHKMACYILASLLFLSISATTLLMILK